MNEEKEVICDAIFSAIQDDIRNLCDTEIFTQSIFMELGEFFYGKLINSVEGATVDLINTVVSVNDAKYDYKLKKYCSNEGNIYTESLGELAYQNNPKFMKFIADNSLGFKAYASFGKNEITERIAVLVDLVKLVWNDDMFI